MKSWPITNTSSNRHANKEDLQDRNLERSGEDRLWARLNHFYLLENSPWKLKQPKELTKEYKTNESMNRKKTDSKRKIIEESIYRRRNYDTKIRVQIVLSHDAAY